MKDLILSKTNIYVCFFLLGAVSILPTILYLTTGVLKECALKSTNDQAILANCPAITAALHCLKVLANDKYCHDERSSKQWRSLLQSALAKVIDLVKTGLFISILIFTVYLY